MSKQKGFVTAVLVIIVLLAIAFFIWRNKTAAPATLENATSTPPSSATAAPGSAKASSPPKSPSLPTRPQISASGAYLVYYTPGGFVPPSLTVPLGKSVHIMNNSNNALRVGSVDTVDEPYASFSQSKSVGKGGYFDYTFISAGAYAYRNLNLPAHTGTIFVR